MRLLQPRLLLALSVISLGLATPALASIRWNPMQLQMSIIPGTIQVVTVQFSTDTEISGASVWGASLTFQLRGLS